MLAFAAGAIWLGLILWLLRRVLIQFSAFTLDALDAALASDAQMPSLSVILPVRNELRNIEACLSKLRIQDYDPYSVIVVDDDSRDGTAEAVQEIVSADERIKLIAAGPLPEGWMGKPHACWRGALSADGEWLCFIDADVRIEPCLLRAAMHAAEARGIDMLSLQPFQELGSFWEKLIIPAGLLMIACAGDLRVVNDPSSSSATANGQFILVKRSTYFAVGGHAAARGEICEDKKLAAMAKQAGFRLRMLSGGKLIRTRMYTGLRSLWEGFSKNAVEILDGWKATALVALIAPAVGWAVPALPVLCVIAAIGRPSALSAWGAALACLGSAVVCGIQMGTMRHFKCSWSLAVLFPFGYTAASLLALSSVAARRGGSVTWKGRRYDIDTASSGGL